MLKPTNRVVVTCSCGDKTQIIWDALNKRYRALDPGWIFIKVEPGNVGKSAGWNCGLPGHYQKGQVVVEPDNDYKF